MNDKRMPMLERLKLTIATGLLYAAAALAPTATWLLLSWLLGDEQTALWLCIVIVILGCSFGLTFLPGAPRWFRSRKDAEQ